MLTPNGPVPPSDIRSTRHARLRLHMIAQPGRSRLDGGWWPRTRNLAVELPDLVDHFPPSFGKVVGALVSPADWDTTPRHVLVTGGYVKVGTSRGEAAHLIQLRTTNRTLLRVLVVPPAFTGDQGDEALLAAATPGNAHSAAELLETVSEAPDVDPRDRWSDRGGSYWGPHSGAPSYRPGP